MGKEQGDHVPSDPAVFVKTIDGEEHERTAYTAADKVQARAEGWRPKSGKPAGKRGGGNQRAAAGEAGSTQGGTA